MQRGGITRLHRAAGHALHENFRHQDDRRFGLHRLRFIDRLRRGRLRMRVCAVRDVDIDRVCAGFRGLQQHRIAAVHAFGVHRKAEFGKIDFMLCAVCIGMQGERDGLLIIVDNERRIRRDLCGNAHRFGLFVILAAKRQHDHRFVAVDQRLIALRVALRHIGICMRVVDQQHRRGFLNGLQDVRLCGGFFGGD